MTTPTPATPELTALQLAQQQAPAMVSALTAAVGMLEDIRRRRPQGLSVQDLVVLDGLRTTLAMLPMLIDYGVEVQTARDALSAKVAGDASDTTAVSLLALLSGIMAACTPPISTPTVTTPAQPLVGSLAESWQAGFAAGYARHAADVLARISSKLA